MFDILNHKTDSTANLCAAKVNERESFWSREKFIAFMYCIFMNVVEILVSMIHD